MNGGRVIARVGQSLATAARHAVPLGGVFARDWHPVTVVAVYWIESVLLVLAAAGLCLLLKRRLSSAVMAAHESGDVNTVRALEQEGARLAKANIEPKEVLTFYLGSMLIFGGFFAGVIIILVGNQHVEPLRWSELADGLGAIAVVVAISFLIDLWSFQRMSVANVQSRVDACMVRWVLFWLLGFFGTMMMAFTGRAATFFGFFAVLKATFETWRTLAGMFGWRSMKDRAAGATPAR